MRVWFYGNCQTVSLYSMFLGGRIRPGVEFKAQPCWTRPPSKVDFTRCIHEADVIVTQPIKDGYGGTDYTNTSYILEQAAGKKVIILNSCHFDFYYPDLQYLAEVEEPAYHHQRLINYYKEGRTPASFIAEVVENEDLMSKEELLAKAEESIGELRKRDEDARNRYGAWGNVHYVSIADFVERNYRRQLLFYSMNHPTKHLLQFIADQITRIAGVRGLAIDRQLDPLANPQRCILYRCIQPAVNFRISDCSVRTLDAYDPLAVAHLYYAAYDKVSFHD